MVEPLKQTDSFADAELGNGDIICFQKPAPPDIAPKRPLAPAHYTYMLNRSVNPICLSLGLAYANVTF